MSKAAAKPKSKSVPPTKGKVSSPKTSRKTAAPPKTPAKKGSKAAKSKSSSVSAEEKLREIATKAGKVSTDNDSNDSGGFSISDIRSLLASRKKGPKSKSSQKKENKDASSSKPSSKKAAKVAKIKKLTSASIDDILGFGVSMTSSKQIRRDENKVPKEWLPFYKALKSMRDSLKGALGERSSETIGASARESGELSLNSSDAGTETFDRDLALSMVANDHEALEEIEDAIDRIFAGSYGVCQQTGKPINKNRLRAVPFTRFSVEGQNLYEQTNRRDRDLGAGSFATISDSTMGEED